MFHPGLIIMKGAATIFLCAVALATAKPGVQPLSIASDAAAACAQPNSEDLLVAHENCNRFNKCNGGKPVPQDCPAGLLYNIDAEICDWASNVDCGERTIAEDVWKNYGEDSGWVPTNGHKDPSQAPAICAAEGSDGVLVAHENCNEFYKCSQGLPVALECPSNLLYHPELEMCDWPQNVDCTGRN